MAILGLLAAAIAWCQEVLVFEAEEYSLPSSVWGKDIDPVDKWDLWGKDPGAEKKWSGGKLLQSPTAPRDRKSLDEGAPPLHTALTGIPAGRWELRIKYGRDLAVSLDGKNWRRLSRIGGVVGVFYITDGRLELRVDDLYAGRGNLGFSCYDCIIVTPALQADNGVVNGNFDGHWYWQAPAKTAS